MSGTSKAYSVRNLVKNTVADRAAVAVILKQELDKGRQFTIRDARDLLARRRFNAGIREAMRTTRDSSLGLIKVAESKVKGSGHSQSGYIVSEAMKATPALIRNLRDLVEIICVSDRDATVEDCDAAKKTLSSISMDGNWQNVKS